MGKILGGKAPEGLLFSRKDIIRMILPAIAEQALAMLVGMADSLMLAGVGERAVSAVSLVDQINILMINLFAALATGGAVIAGQCLGAKDDKRACHITDQLALVQILLGVGISAVLFFLPGALAAGDFWLHRAENHGLRGDLHGHYRRLPALHRAV